MATSKIGRLINPREKVTPGFKQEKREQTKLEKLEELVYLLESTIDEQELKIKELDNKIKILENNNKTDIQKLSNTNIVQDKVLEEINLLISKLEEKINTLEENSKILHKSIIEDEKNSKEEKLNSHSRVWSWF